MDQALSSAVRKLNVDAVALYFKSPSGSIDFLQGRGFSNQELQFAINNPISENARKKILSGEEIVIPEIFLNSITDDNLTNAEERIEFVSYHATPLIISGHTRGVVEAYSRSYCGDIPRWLDSFDFIAHHISRVLDNSGSYNHHSPVLRAKTPKHSATLDALMAAMLLRSGEIESHARRVTDMTLHLAKSMGLTDDQLSNLVRGAMLHDIGKLAIPDSILNKPGPLTSSEWDLMRKHPEFAFKLLSPIPSLKSALSIPYSHHEWWDGSGYPLGLKHEQIPLPARIFSVVDVWDALRSDRPYRKAWKEQDVLNYIREHSGSQFDPQITDTFLDLI
ncbi:MAG: HD domain-containing protein [Chloroflexota bacterium]